MMTILLTLIPILLLAVTAQAATFHVKTTGNNSNTCTQAQTDTTPKATLGGTTGAAQCASAGDTIEIWAGTYTTMNGVTSNAGLLQQNQTLANGTSGSRITVQKHGTDVVWIQPTGGSQVFNLLSLDYWTFDGINTDGRNLGCPACPTANWSIGDTAVGITLQNLTARDASNNSTGTAQTIFLKGDGHLLQNIVCDGTHKAYGDYMGSHCIYAGDTMTNTIIERSEIKNAGGIGITLNYSGGSAVTGNIVRRNNIHHNGRNPQQTRNGLTINAHQDGVLAENNLIHNNPAHGVTIYGVGLIRTKFYNNTIVNNLGNCISVGTSNDAVDVELRNNICMGNSAGIRIYSLSNNTIVSRNVVWKSPSGYGTPIIDEAAPPNGSASTISGNVFADPLLTNIGSVDFHLLTGSSAIDIGNYTGAPTVDYAGTTRSGTNDAGAYNFGTAVLPNHLSFLAPPVSGTIVGAELADVVVEVLDAANVRQTADTGNCVASKATGTGTLGGTLTRAVSSGLCTFDDLTFDAADTDFSITITKSGGTAATEVTSLQFSVVTAPSGQGSPTLILRQY